MITMGVDPGLGGALATWDTEAKVLTIDDMPSWSMMVKKKTRKRIDAVQLADMIEYAKLMGVHVVMIEAVGGRPQQNAGAAFVFGYTVGLVYMSCIASRLPIETVPSQVWKRAMGVPGKKEITKDMTGAAKAGVNKALANAIIKRCDELFPDYTHLWRGTKGGFKLDRAEAALLAYYAAYSQPSTRKVNLSAAEFAMVYKNADTGS